MSDSEKPKLGMRAPLGLKRTVETGQVKQSFSHGRSNTVVVEVKRRRVLGRPGEAEPQVIEEPAAAAPAPQAPAPQAAAPAPRPQPAPAPVVNTRALTPLERREQQERLLREAEEARMTALEETRRREERLKAEASEEEKRRAEENRRAEEAGESAPAQAPA
ncbi:translation initiation factor IF-2 associated domain-containing protein, partial [Rhizorhabdus sp.]|uniref:translation initiation factor IF-2 associated domain-containing protein n=1 Tax=Rhizorhabdus sp. TaxID=1968843 RepID=UPI0019CCEE52